MKNPFPWKVRSPLTVVTKESHRRSRRNPGFDAAILRCGSTRASGRPAGRNDRGDRAPLPAPTVRPRPASASHDLLIYLGHSESCAALRRRHRHFLLHRYVMPSIGDLDINDLDVSTIKHVLFETLSQGTSRETGYRTLAGLAAVCHSPKVRG